MKIKARFAQSSRGLSDGSLSLQLVLVRALPNVGNCVDGKLSDNNHVMASTLDWQLNPRHCVLRMFNVKGYLY